MTKDTIAELTIESLLQQWPQTAEVFQQYQMACVGCVMAPFYSVIDAIAIYDVDEELFLKDLIQAIKKSKEIGD